MKSPKDTNLEIQRGASNPIAAPWGRTWALSKGGGRGRPERKLERAKNWGSQVYIFSPPFKKKLPFQRELFLKVTIPKGWIFLFIIFQHTLLFYKDKE